MRSSCAGWPQGNQRDLKTHCLRCGHCCYAPWASSYPSRRGGRAMTHEAVTAAPTNARQTLPVRLGVIDYLNCVPVYDWLLGQMASDGLPGIETVAGTPAQMNQAL